MIYDCSLFLSSLFFPASDSLKYAADCNICFSNQSINHITSFTIYVTGLALKFPLHTITGGCDRPNDAATKTDDCNKLRRVSTSLCRWHDSWWLLEPSGCQRAVTSENWSQGLGWESHTGKVCEGRREWLTPSSLPMLLLLLQRYRCRGLHI